MGALRHGPNRTGQAIGRAMLVIAIALAAGPRVPGASAPVRPTVPGPDRPGLVPAVEAGQSVVAVAGGVPVAEHAPPRTSSALAPAIALAPATALEAAPTPTRSPAPATPHAPAGSPAPGVSLTASPSPGPSPAPGTDAAAPPVIARPQPSPWPSATPAPSAGPPVLVRSPIGGSAWDVVVYGGTPGGVMAAVTAARAGARVLLVEPTQHVGGMMTSGLTYTDVGDFRTLGGYTWDFFSRMESAGGTVASRFHFESRVAEQEFETILEWAGVTVWRGQPLREQAGVVMAGTAIRRIVTASGVPVDGRVFIDASYEADLLAAAGVTYHVGREAAATYGEALGGARTPAALLTVPPGVGLGFPTAEPAAPGQADGGIQNANYRVCFSSEPANQVPFAPPPGYDAADYEVVLAYIAARVAGGGVPNLDWFLFLGALTNEKFDVNEYGWLSMGVPGLIWSYPEATYAERAAIELAHRLYGQGFIWFLATDPRVPAAIRSELAGYGLCADEFAGTGNWPHRLYVREGRRMVGTYVLTQADIEINRTKPDAIGIASYALDAHAVARWMDDDRVLWVEGGFFGTTTGAWSIPYRSLLPQAAEATNLLVPVAASASHVAWASLRMEPQFMVMGEAAGEAAAMAALAPGSVDLHGLDIGALRAALEGHGVKLDADPYLGEEIPIEIEAAGGPAG